MLSFAFTVLVLVLCGLCGYFYARLERVQVGRLLKTLTRRQDSRIRNLSAQVGELTAIVKAQTENQVALELKLKNSAGIQTTPVTNPFTKSEDRHEFERGKQTRIQQNNHAPEGVSG